MPRKGYVMLQSHKDKISESNMGRVMSEGTKDLLSISAKKQFENPENRLKGEKNPRWKEEVTPRSAHRWASKAMEETEKCRCCGASICPICGKAGIVHRCNIDHKYRKNIGEWFWACNQCHRDIDIKNGLRGNV